MNKARHLLYVGDVAPGLGHGGRVVINRHLRRLADDGWIITVVTSATDCAAGPWTLVSMPARRTWWPPFRPAHPWLARLRAFAWTRELRGIPPADAILTLCWGPLAWLAAHLSETTRAPLLAFLHDHWAEGGSIEDALVGARACRAARVVLTVSEEMRLRVDADFGPGKAVVLPPIPATRTLPFAAWREDFSSPAVAHVGTLQPYHENFLLNLATKLMPMGGRLLLLCPRSNPTAAALVRRCPNLVHQDFFPENSDALRWVSTHASGLAVMYRHGLDANGHPPTGFPSRFVEFTQLGLPILLAAPSGNPIRSWAASHNWTGQCDPADQSALEHWLRSLTAPDAWSALAAESRRTATTDFDPAHIHAQLTSVLFL